MFYKIAALLTLATLFLVTPAEAADASKPCTGTPTSYNHVIVWMLENHSIDQTRGHMPYLDSIADQCGYFTKERAITHPSLPNYIAITSGAQQGITTNHRPTGSGLPANNIFNQVGRWNSWHQSMPSNCYMKNKYPYMAHHNPALYFADLRAECGQRDMPMTQLQSSLTAKVPKFALLVPDNCNNGHINTCGGSTAQKAATQADDYLQAHLPDILNSPAYQAGDTLVVITWDEGGGGGQHVYTVIIGPSFHGEVYTAKYDHYSLLQLFERVLNVPCLRHACGAVKISLP